ncbi:jg4318, partial [Pararge aegeria aegeria]
MTTILPIGLARYHLRLHHHQKELIFRQGYGLTETNGGISVGHNKDTNHAAVGHNFYGSELKIADLKTQEALGAGK